MFLFFKQIIQWLNVLFGNILVASQCSKKCYRVACDENNADLTAYKNMYSFEDQPNVANFRSRHKHLKISVK